jgi:hypothetical protein
MDCEQSSNETSLNHKISLIQNESSLILDELILTYHIFEKNMKWMCQ